MPDEMIPPSGTVAPTGSARAIIDAALTEYGLQGLSDWAWGRYTAGLAPEQIMIELRKRPEYSTRFPAIKALGEKGRSISEAEYVAYEKQVTQLYRSYGLPSGFYDQPSDFAALIAGEVSPVEVSQRLAAYQSVAFSEDPNVRNELSRLYGITEGELTAYFIDPEQARPILERRAQAAERSAAALQFGFQGLDQTEAERLTPYSRGDVLSGFSDLAGEKELFAPVSLGENQIDEGTQIAAKFGGNAQAKAAVEKRRARRKAEFEAGGGYATSQRGIAGLGGS